MAVRCQRRPRDAPLPAPWLRLPPEYEPRLPLPKPELLPRPDDQLLDDDELLRRDDELLPVP